MNRADARARLAAAQAAASGPASVVSLVIRPDTPDGFSAWAVGPVLGARHIVIVPTLSTDAPPVVVDRLVAAVVGDATGRCPLCGGVADLSPSIPDPALPSNGRVAWETLAVIHSRGCPALFADDERGWFDQRAFQDPEGDPR